MRADPLGPDVSLREALSILEAASELVSSEFRALQRSLQATGLQVRFGG